jgi:TRAP-type transport system small permease protein
MLIRVLSKLNTLLQRCASGITVAAMTVIAVVIPYEVFGRYILSAMPVWSGEVSTYALVWASMMGGAAGIKKGYQVSLTILEDRLPEALSRAVIISAQMIMIIFLCIMVFSGMQQTIVNRNQFSAAMGIPMSFPYLALPAGFMIMLLTCLEECYRFFQPASGGSRQC